MFGVSIRARLCIFCAVSVAVVQRPCRSAVISVQELVHLSLAITQRLHISGHGEIDPIASQL
jgi:hypothetical protein